MLSNQIYLKFQFNYFIIIKIHKDLQLHKLSLHQFKPALFLLDSKIQKKLMIVFTWNIQKKSFMTPFVFQNFIFSIKKSIFYEIISIQASQYLRI